MHRVGAQRLRVVEILPAGNQSPHPLPQHGLVCMHDLATLSFGAESASHVSDQIEFPIHFAHQQQTTVAADLSARKVGLHLPPLCACECQLFTLDFSHRVVLLFVSHLSDYQRVTKYAIPFCEIFGLTLGVWRLVDGSEFCPGVSILTNSSFNSPRRASQSAPIKFVFCAESGCHVFGYTN